MFLIDKICIKNSASTPEVFLDSLEVIQVLECGRVGWADCVCVCECVCVCVCVCVCAVEY